jgi:hypothetical protein
MRRAVSASYCVLRNSRASTAIRAYSPWARPCFPIAVPVTWTQVEPFAWGLPVEGRTVAFDAFAEQQMSAFIIACPLGRRRDEPKQMFRDYASGRPGDVASPAPSERR